MERSARDGAWRREKVCDRGRVGAGWRRQLGEALGSWLGRLDVASAIPRLQDFRNKYGGKRLHSLLEVSVWALGSRWCRSSWTPGRDLRGKLWPVWKGGAVLGEAAGVRRLIPVRCMHGAEIGQRQVQQSPPRNVLSLS